MFLLIEDVSIVALLFDGVRIQSLHIQGLNNRIFRPALRQFRTVCLVLLVAREGNSWSQQDHDKFLKEATKHHGLPEIEERRDLQLRVRILVER